MKKYLTVLSLFFIFAVAEAYAQTNSLSVYFEKTDLFFKTYAHNGNFDYQSLKKNDKSLQELIKMVGESKPTASQKKAFYINAYNILVIKAVLNHYPLKSVMDIDGFFDKLKHKVAGEMLTLNELEKGKLMPIDHDARLHFVLVCAAKSCPPLASFAFRPEKLDAQLNERTKLAMNTSWFIRVNKSTKTVEASKIFDWYKNDFGDTSGILPYINKYKSVKIPSGYKLAFYEYDWSLNGL
ncbi:MAG: DUF547 domain-containing protein [Cyclobacteriaceae bacterium]|nr:DUF547 domain-containing protein [Cyclobacteriaceae bacterium]